MANTVTRIGLGLGAAVLTLGIAAALASAQNTNGGPGTFSGRRGGPGPGPGRGPDGRGRGGPIAGFVAPLRMLAARVDLSDGQKSQIQSIVQSHTEEWKALADRERQGRQALEAAIAADQFDELAIRQRSAEMAIVEADIAVAGARARAELFQILTPDQQAKAKARQSRLQGRGGARGRRGQRG